MADELNVIPSAGDSGSPLGDKNQESFMRDLIETFWRYREERFPDRDDLFDRATRSMLRPPVFKKGFEEANILVSEAAPPGVKSAVQRAIPFDKRHRFFRSMKSSQALVQSVFGNLLHYHRLDILAGLQSDDGEVAFFAEAPAASAVELEHEVTHLGEPRNTTIDLFIAPPSRVAVECKFTEWEVGSCSRPMMEDEDPRYCNGTYRRQGGRANRCQLTEAGVRYWHEIPRLFRWPADQDQAPCPVRFTYQLVRNVLAACIRPDGQLDENAHALLVYDARNPAFQHAGAGMRSWQEVRDALKEPTRIRRVSWQKISARIVAEEDLAWLAAALEQKYGIAG